MRLQGNGERHFKPGNCLPCVVASKLFEKARAETWSSFGHALAIGDDFQKYVIAEFMHHPRSEATSRLAEQSGIPGLVHSIARSPLRSPSSADRDGRNVAGSWNCDT